MTYDKECAIPRNDMRQALHGIKPMCPEGKVMGAVPYVCRKDRGRCRCLKPIVLYIPSESEWIAIGFPAYIQVVDGKKYVYTTHVVKYNQTTDEFETDTTIYRPMK